MKTTDLKKSAYQKLALKKEGLYGVIKVQKDTLIVDLTSIHNMASIDDVTLVSTRDEAGAAMITPEVENDDECIHAEDGPALKDKKGDSPQASVVEMVVDECQEVKEARSWVRWYEFTLDDDT